MFQWSISTGPCWIRRAPPKVFGAGAEAHGMPRWALVALKHAYIHMVYKKREQVPPQTYLSPASTHAQREYARYGTSASNNACPRGAEILQAGRIRDRAAAASGAHRTQPGPYSNPRSSHAGGGLPVRQRQRQDVLVYPVSLHAIYRHVTLHMHMHMHMHKYRVRAAQLMPPTCLTGFR